MAGRQRPRPAGDGFRASGPTGVCTRGIRAARSAPAVPAPPKPSAVGPKYPQPVILEALAKALQNVSSDRTAAPTIILVATDSVRVLRNALSDRQSAAKMPVKPAVKEPAPAAADAPAPPPRPAWVDAAPKMDGDAYVMARQVGPYTALPECERELAKVLEQAVAEYADLLLGREKAHDVHLPDNVLEGLVRQSWTEHLTQEFGGAVQDMVVLHVLIGFDPLAQERIREASEHTIAVRHVQEAGVALGGVLGLLALAWCGLSVFGPRKSRNRRKKRKMRRKRPHAALDPGRDSDHDSRGGHCGCRGVLCGTLTDNSFNSFPGKNGVQIFSHRLNTD